jgi:anti-sigma factor RsiW
MPCNFDEKLLHLFVDEELGQTQKALTLRHIEGCEHCLARVRKLEAIRNSVRLACQSHNAPLSLKAKIQQNLDNEQMIKQLKLSLTDRIRLFLGELKPVQAAAAGVILILIISFIFIPGKSPVSNLAEALALEHIKHGGLIDETGIESSKGSEIADFLAGQVGHQINVSDCLDSDLCVSGGCLEKFGGQSIAHIIYKNHTIHCSLFIIDASDSSGVLSNILVANDDTFQIGQSQKAQYVCWKNDGKIFILVGRCTSERLLGLARNSI